MIARRLILLLEMAQLLWMNQKKTQATFGSSKPSNEGLIGRRQKIPVPSLWVVRKRVLQETEMIDTVHLEIFWTTFVLMISIWKISKETYRYPAPVVLAQQNDVGSRYVPTLLLMASLYRIR